MCCAACRAGLPLRNMRLRCRFGRRLRKEESLPEDILSRVSPGKISAMEVQYMERGGKQCSIQQRAEKKYQSLHSEQ
jgi:hypothetical protein